MKNKDEARAGELLEKIFENKEDMIESFIEVFGTKEFEEFMCIGVKKHLMKALVPLIEKIKEETRKEITQSEALRNRQLILSIFKKLEAKFTYPIKGTCKILKNNYIQPNELIITRENYEKIKAGVEK